MPAIPLAEAMFVWTPKIGPLSGPGTWAPAGSIVVAHWPDDRGAYTRFPLSAGACDRPWQEGDDDYRLQTLANLIAQWLKKDALDPKHVAEALKIVDGLDGLSSYKGVWPDPKYGD